MNDGKNIHGPHCPKCGCANQWEFYSGESTENPDALRCTSTTINGAAGSYQAPDGCGYIYWRRGAGAEDNPLPDTGDPFQPMRDRIARRARIRALVHSLLLAPQRVTLPPGCDYVQAAIIIDDEIEKIGMTSGES
jgi:hypothetical protein